MKDGRVEVRCGFAVALLASGILWLVLALFVPKARRLLRFVGV